jgi:hypothetical protein
MTKQRYNSENVQLRKREETGKEIEGAAISRRTDTELIRIAINSVDKS